MTFTKFATALVATATIGAATVAAADTSYFSYQRTLPAESRLDLGVVTSEGNGTVEIYDYRGGEIGALLGTKDVFAGANGNVFVNVGVRPSADVIAVLRVDGQAVATRDYYVDRF